MNKKIQRTLALVAVAGLALGAVATTSAQATKHKEKTVKLAFQGPLTGGSAQVGQDEIAGAIFALSEYHATNPAVKVVLVRADDQGDGTVAASIAPGIAADRSIIGVIGPAFSGASLNSFPSYKATGLTMISPSATRVSLTDRKSKDNGFPVFHRVVANDKFQAPALVRYAIKGVTAPKVYLVDDLSPYGAGLARFAKFTLVGGILVGTDSIPQQTVDYTSAVAKVKASGANVVIYAGYQPDGSKFVKTLRDGGYTGIFAAGDGVATSDFPKNAGKAAEGARLTAADVPFELLVNAAKLAAFSQVTGAKVPGLYVTSTYNATNIFLACIKQGRITRPGIQNCVKNGSWKGVAGDTIKFDRYGDIIGGAAVGAFTVKDGVLTYIGVA